MRVAAERRDDMASSVTSLCAVTVMHCVCWRSCADNNECKANGMTIKNGGELPGENEESGARGGTRTPTS